ncbi:hypothetical protein DPMN_076368 [Dreissena polymorpha]|uniref:Mucin-4-like C8-3 domain-containing protein n=1 Tax=Dreissena polymorpha TaxID=45954 RepID=A0A9D3YNJ1_DREPO|nr:hypothetical protein DPMN_076368 [Dreissena polymorpha]
MTTAQESIFKYADGYTHANFVQENFTPKFPEEANATLRAEAEQKCNKNLQCVFDFIFTGNEQLARETERTEELAVRANEAASTFNCKMKMIIWRYLTKRYIELNYY